MTFERLAALEESHIRDLHALYQDEWWSGGRRLEDIRRMLDRTDHVVAFAESGTGRLAAFARVLTDGVYRATLYDVIVAAPFRGKGLGRKVVEAILQDPELSRVEAIDLCCRPELLPFYAQWGFTEVPPEVRLARLRRGAAGGSPTARTSS